MNSLASKVADQSCTLTDTQQVTANAGKLLGHRIWLPKVLYAALPVFYIVSGLLALVATLYISAWFWVLPHYLIFSAACVHLGTAIYRRRRRTSP